MDLLDGAQGGADPHPYGLAGAFYRVGGRPDPATEAERAGQLGG
ncbi:MAG: hypothetical protein JWR88_788, partial [Pseudonocardia sp.]|nr:hypothetical protein [Pseudonocardia sp.]